MEQTTWLRDLIYELWARQAMLETPGDTRLRLQAPWGDELQVERHRALRTVRVSYYLAKGKPARRRQTVKDLEVVLLVTPQGKWAPIEFYRAQTGNAVYVLVDPETGEPRLLDAINQRACAHYCDGWSFHLREQGWLEKGMVI